MSAVSSVWMGSAFSCVVDRSRKTGSEVWFCVCEFVLALYCTPVLELVMPVDSIVHVFVCVCVCV